MTNVQRNEITVATIERMATEGHNAETLEAASEVMEAQAEAIAAIMACKDYDITADMLSAFADAFDCEDDITGYMDSDAEWATYRDVLAAVA